MVQGERQLEQCPVRGWFFGRDRFTESRSLRCHDPCVDIVFCFQSDDDSSHVNPTITATNFSVSANQSVGISSDLTVSNPSGDKLTIYRVIDGGHGTGHLTVGGTVEPDGQWIVASANWSNVQYVGGSSAGTDALKVEAYDATTKSWVLSNVFKATTASPSPPPSPVGVQDHQGLEPSASIIGIQDHQGLEHQTMV